MAAAPRARPVSRSPSQLSGSSPASSCNTADHHIHFPSGAAAHAASAHESDIASLHSPSLEPSAPPRRSGYSPQTTPSSTWLRQDTDEFLKPGSRESLNLIAFYDNA